MFVGVVAFRYQQYMVSIMECHNSHKHSQSSLTSYWVVMMTCHNAAKLIISSSCQTNVTAIIIDVTSKLY